LFVYNSIYSFIGSEVSIERPDMRAIRDLEVADFIEILLSDAVGAENVFAFLSHCLN
jgi:hypothetical protein